MKNLSGIQPLLSLLLLWAPTLLHAATVPIDPGETVTGVLALGATNTYSFTGTSGEVVNVWMVKTGGSGINPTVELYDPNGAAVVGAVANVSAVSSLIQAQALTKTGTYTIVCRDDVGNETYPYSVTLVKLPGSANAVDPGDSGGSILPGQTLTNLLGQVADIDTFTFAGTAGEVVTAWMVKTGSGNFPVVEVYDPDGVLLSYAQGNINSQSSLIQAQPLTKTGTYTILCRDDIGTETYPYSLTMTKFPGGSNQVDPGDWGGSILPGQTLTNLLGQVADIDTFTFVGTAGEVVTAWMIKTGGSGNFPLLEVYDPDGVLLSYAQGNINSQSSLIQAQRLTRTGTYTILCRDDIGTETYPYWLTFVANPGPNQADAGDHGPVIVPGVTITNGISWPADIDALSFHAVAGDTIRVAMSKTGVPGQYAYLEVEAPDGTIMSSGVSTSGQGARLDCVPQTGDYLILCRGLTGAELFSYTLSLTQSPIEPPSSGTNQNLTVYSCGNDEVHLRWSTSASGYQLQSTPNFQPAIWQAVTNVPYVIADHFYVDVGTVTNVSTFYRLICTNGPCGQ